MSSAEKDVLEVKLRLVTFICVIHMIRASLAPLVTGLSI